MIQTPVTPEINDLPVMNTELESLDIPLKQLLVWNQNVRTTGADKGIGELAASIASVGLLQSLVVRKETRGKYAVVAGRRRLMALSLLVERGAASPTMQIPCRLVAKMTDSTEVGLTENVMRDPMHPADEFEAFQSLIVNGKSVADVAARFGVAENVVLKRLALARVSPALIQQYREGKLNLDVLQAFTLTDDHARQEQVWNELREWDRSAQTIRRLLSADDIPASDKRVRFVGFANYEANGGFVRRDLFAEGEQGAYILDAAKLTRMVNEKLELTAAHLKDDGWKWVQVQPEADPQFTARMRRLPPETVALTAEEEVEIAALEDKRSQLEEQVEAKGQDNSDDALYDQIEEIDERIHLIQSNRQRTYSHEVKASCGVVVNLDWNGEPQITYGLLRKEDEQALVQSSDPSSSDEPRNALEAQEAPSAAYSASLIEFLTQHKTAAIAAELANQPLTALAAVVHAMVLGQFGLDLRLYRTQTSLQVSTTLAHLEGVQDTHAIQTLGAQRNDWLAQLPRTPRDLWRWCLEQDQDTLLRLLAFCSAMTVNAVRTKADSEKHYRLQHADMLATALGMDMSRWFTPTVDNFYSKIPKSKIVRALTEAGKAPNADTVTKLKKAEFAAFAERTMQDTGWLPEPVRIAAEQEEEIGFTLDNEADEPGDDQ